MMEVEDGKKSEMIMMNGVSMSKLTGSNSEASVSTQKRGMIC